MVYAAAGAVIGTLLGHWLTRFWAPLGHDYLRVGMGADRPWTLNLGVLRVAFGVWLHLNLVGLVGIVVGLWAHRRGR